jgi:hypothetical protein
MGQCMCEVRVQDTYLITCKTEEPHRRPIIFVDPMRIHMPTQYFDTTVPPTPPQHVCIWTQNWDP